MNSNLFGLPTTDYNAIITEIKKFPEITKVIIFGSRAKGSYKIGSDIDLALFINNNSLDILGKLKWNLEEESILPFFFDLVCYDDNLNENLKEHINRVGLIFYVKDQPHSDN